MANQLALQARKVLNELVCMVWLASFRVFLISCKACMGSLLHHTTVAMVMPQIAVLYLRLLGILCIGRSGELENCKDRGMDREMDGRIHACMQKGTNV